MAQRYDWYWRPNPFSFLAVSYIYLILNVMCIYNIFMKVSPTGPVWVRYCTMIRGCSGWCILLTKTQIIELNHKLCITTTSYYLDFFSRIQTINIGSGEWIHFWSLKKFRLYNLVLCARDHYTNQIHLSGTNQKINQLKLGLKNIIFMKHTFVVGSAVILTSNIWTNTIF